MIAIARDHANDRYYIADTKTGRRGIYLADGTLVGDEQILTKEEAAYRIWLQTQGAGSDSVMRKRFAAIKGSK